MKKTIYRFTLLFTLIISSCTSEPKPQGIVVEQTFELLQKMQNISQEEFNSYFISLDELRAIATDTTVEASFRKAITNVSKETHTKRLQQSYNMIQESGKRYDIEWKTIKFREYPYQLREQKGITFQDGFLAFDTNEKKLVAKIVSINYKGKERLFNLSNVEPVRKQ